MLKRASQRNIFFRTSGSCLSQLVKCPMRKPSPREPGVPARLQRLADLAGSVVALAEICGVSRRGLNDWLNSVRPAHPTLLAKIAEATGTDPEWLREGRGTPPTRLSPQGPAHIVSLIPMNEPHVRSILAIDRNWLHLRLGLAPERAILWNQPDDSMEPLVGLGDPVLCRPWPKDSPPPITGLTRYCLVRKGEDVNLRCIFRLEGTGSIVLRPRNPKYPEILLPADAEILAEAIWGGHSLEQPMKESRNKSRAPW